MDDRVPELVSDLQDQVAAQIKAAFPSIAPEKARDVGLRVADYITTNWGGQLIYIPKNVGGRASERDLQIWADFDGRNQIELAQKYGMSVQWIYRILKEVGEMMRAKTQGKLFDE